MTLIDKQQAQALGIDRFLSQALGSKTFQVFQLAGDASTRKYYRVVDNDTSWVLMSWEPFPENPEEYPLLSVVNHFKKHHIQTPKILATSPSEGFILQEDLGDLTLERKFWENQNQEHVLPFYKLAIDELIKIHYPATQDRNSCMAFQVAFDIEKFVWELNYAQKYFLQELCQIPLSKSEEKALHKDFLEISTILHKEPKFISHRDYHSRNLMLKFGKIRVIDFQDARMGPIQYDLVSLLKDSYVDMSSSIADELLGYYLQQRSQYFSPIEDIHHFNYIYEVQSVQRCFKACGSFASFFVMRQDTRYLKYLTKTVGLVLESLRQTQLFPNLLDVLEKHHVSEREFESR